jgi:hypothetical protein
MNNPQARQGHHFEPNPSLEEPETEDESGDDDGGDEGSEEVETNSKPFHHVS